MASALMLKTDGKDLGRRIRDLTARILDSLELPSQTVPPEVHIMLVYRQNSETASGDAYAKRTGVGGATKWPEPLAPLMVDNRSLVAQDPLGIMTLRVRPSLLSIDILNLSSTLTSPSSLYADDGAQRTASSVHFIQNADQYFGRSGLNPRLRE